MLPLVDTLSFSGRELNKFMLLKEVSFKDTNGKLDKKQMSTNQKNN